MTTWIRDFVLLGGGLGGLAPLAVFGPILLQSPAHPEVIAFLLAGCLAGGAAIGTLVGGLLFGVTRATRDVPLASFGAGFPIGALAGGVVGATIGEFIGAATFVGTLGAITGGLTLGMLWVPYLALRLRERSGLPVIAVGTFGAPFVGALAIVSLMAIEAGLGWRFVP